MREGTRACTHGPACYLLVVSLRARADRTLLKEGCLLGAQNQWLLFSVLQRSPVICNEYKAHTGAQEKARWYASPSPCLLPEPLRLGHTQAPQEIGLNY